jgi:putative spermidine/putrescine transport system substrate-binding protein
MSHTKLSAARGLTRRQTLRLGGIAAASIIVRPARGDAGKVVVGSWGGAYTDAQSTAYFKPFEAATGIKVEIVTAGNLTAAAIKGFVETGHYDWDWTTLGSTDYTNASRNGWLEPIDYGLIDKSNKTENQFFKDALGAESTSDIIAYRTDVFPNGGPEGWKDYWDVAKFPGPRTIWKSPFPLLEAALVADGVALDKLYPLDLDRAFKKADQIKDKITVWWESGSQSQDAIVSKNVVISAMWNGRAGISARDGAPIKINWEQGFYDPAFYVVPKGTPNKANAMRLIDWAAGPKGLAKFAELTFYGPSNLKAIDLVDPKIRPLMNTGPENLAKQIRRNYDWWGDNLAKVKERFVSWLVT